MKRLFEPVSRCLNPARSIFKPLQRRIVVLACGLLGVFGLAGHAQEVQYPYEYDFFASDGSGVTGKLFLDASSSTSGTLSDIGPGSYLSFDLYGYSVILYLNGVGPGSDQSHPFFSWDATSVTSPLFIGFLAGYTSVGYVGYETLLSREFVDPGDPHGPEYDRVDVSFSNFTTGRNLYTGETITEPTVCLVAGESVFDINGNGGILVQQFYPGTAGEWLAVPSPSPAPEPGTTTLLLLALPCLGFFVWQSRRKPALARIQRKKK